jgi:hypothetical protein
MWRANRLIQRITIQPRLATARDYDRAEAACMLVAIANTEADIPDRDRA